MTVTQTVLKEIHNMLSCCEMDVSFNVTFYLFVLGRYRRTDRSHFGSLLHPET